MQHIKDNIESYKLRKSQIIVPPKTKHKYSDNSTEGILKEHGKRFDKNKVKLLTFEILKKVIDSKITEREKLDKYMKSLQKEYKTSISRKNLLMSYRFYSRKGLLKYDETYEIIFQSKPFRSESGVLAYGIMLSPYPIYTVKKKDIDMEDMSQKNVTLTPIENDVDHIQVQQMFSCAFDCGYCPKKPGLPRSYLEGEPAVSRAARLKFVIKKQIWNRLDTYFLNGHPLNKFELIVLGGTFDSFPVQYINEAMAEIYYAHNIYHEYADLLSQFKLKHADVFESDNIPDIDDTSDSQCSSNCDEKDKDKNKNKKTAIDALLEIFFEEEMKKLRKPLSVAEEIKINESTKCRIIGLTIETRPDQISARSIKRYRSYGVTRVQLGAQHTDNQILYRINRRCYNEDTTKAIKLLKDNNIKVDIHIMPDLPQPFKELTNEEYNLLPESQKKRFSLIKYDREKLRKGMYVVKYELRTIDDIDFTVDMVKVDTKMLIEINTSPKYKPDQIKIYPCETTEWSDIKNDYLQGLYKPYGDQKVRSDMTPLFEVLLNYKMNVGEEVRLNRVVRDIPQADIIGGNCNTNMRNDLENELKKRKKCCRCIRCREVGNRNVDISQAIFVVRQYLASMNYKNINTDEIGGIPHLLSPNETEMKDENGSEFFLSYETKEISPIENSQSSNSNNVVFDTKEALLGFLRLRLSKTAGYDHLGNVVFEELVDTALIRELHVYGQVVNLGLNKDKIVNKTVTQHQGFGTKLMNQAFEISKLNGYKKIAVVAGTGVKDYYINKFGFTDTGNFLVKTL